MTSDRSLDDVHPQTLVNTNLYPLHKPSGNAYQSLVRESRERMHSDGVCLLHDFITPDALTRIRSEALSSLGNAFYCHNTHNAYLKADDPAFSEHHPRRRQLQTDVGSIAYDLLPQGGALVSMYRWDNLTRFIGDVLAIDDFYRLADPLGALSINVFGPGGSHAWHFDESAFSVTLMVQPADAGGLFQYVANVRSEDDDNYAGVEAILDGDESAVETLPLKPGTLSIFAGRHTLHRVTKVEGDAHRLVPVLCYSRNAGVKNSDAVRKLFWGRVG